MNIDDDQRERLRVRACEVEKKWRVRRGLTKDLHHVANVKRKRRRALRRKPRGAG
jgi:hypothetical protein